jgi:hypothetical protein
LATPIAQGEQRLPPIFNNGRDIPGRTPAHPFDAEAHTCWYLIHRFPETAAAPDALMFPDKTGKTGKIKNYERLTRIEFYPVLEELGIDRFTDLSTKDDRPAAIAR